MKRPAARTNLQKARYRPRVKLWLETGGRYSFGFGLFQILEAVSQTGSIKQAAEQLGKSYRYVWGRIKQAEKAAGLALVNTQVGGQGAQRSSLTAEAKELAAAYGALRHRIIQVMNQEFSRRFC